MAQFSKNKLTGFLTVLLAWFSMAGWAAAAEVATESLDQKIDAWFGKITKPFVDLIFFKIKIGGFEAFAVIFWLAAAGVIITLAFMPQAIRSYFGDGESIGVSIWPHLAGVAAFIAYVLYSAAPGSSMMNGRFAAALLAAIVLVWGLWFLQAPLVRKKGD